MGEGRGGEDMTQPAKHTPGPWRIIDSRDQSKATIVGADFPAMGFVADVNLCRNNTHQQVDGRANANLIAAAPAMYALIKDMRQAFYVDGKRKALLAVMERSHDVVAQAEGRQLQP